MATFEELGVVAEIGLALVDLGFEVPMPVQEQVIPRLLGGNEDLVVLAQTGTGKTAAYGIPLLQQIDTDVRTPQALILSPTRELCIQIAGDLKDFAAYIEDFHVLPVYGGSSLEEQARTLKKGVQVVVATPGRLLDLIRRKAIRLKDVRTVVLDEADEMLSMGFIDSINDILAEVPKDRKTLLFSATMPNEVAAISREYMNNPGEITVGGRNSGAENIKHQYFTVHARDKYTALKRIVDFYPSIYGIIFCRTRTDTQEIADKLIADGYNAEALHGDLSQAQRDSVMQKFRIRHLKLLVATDVAARGLDVDDLSHVINYALPDDLAAYTHRSGRTGRAGKAGISVAIINLKEKHLIRKIEKLIGKNFSAMQVPGGREICEKQLFNMINRMEQVEIDHKEIDPYLPAIYRKLEWLDKEEVIKRFVALEFNRFLDYYRNAVDINVHEEKQRGPASEGKPGKPDKSEVTRFQRLIIDAGKADKIYPADIIELVNSCSRGKRIRIGAITLGRNDSSFEVDAEYASFLLEALQGSECNGRTLTFGMAKGAEPVSVEGRRFFPGKGKPKEWKKNRKEGNFQPGKKSWKKRGND